MKHGFLWSFTDDSKCAAFLFLLEFQKKKKKEKKSTNSQQKRFNLLKHICVKTFISFIFWQKGVIFITLAQLF